MNLAERILSVTAHRKSRYGNALYLLNHLEELPELIQLCTGNNEALAVKACWVLEFVYQEKPAAVFPYIPQLVAQLPNITHHSAKRPLCHILNLFVEKSVKDPAYKNVLTQDIVQQLTEVCFDWLINDEKVALKCYSMRILGVFGKENNWIYQELEPILITNIPLHSAAYGGAAKDVLKKIRK